MKAESLPPIKEIYAALEEATIDLYGFAVVCQGGAAMAAEGPLLETLLLGLESFWFTENESGVLTHKEFQEDFFRLLWKKSLEQPHSSFRVGVDLPLGHEEMRFYQLPQLARALLYLRTKKSFSYAALSLVFEASPANLEEEIEKAREFLLGHRIKLPEWSEEDF